MKRGVDWNGQLRGRQGNSTQAQIFNGHQSAELWYGSTLTAASGPSASPSSLLWSEVRPPESGKPIELLKLPCTRYIVTRIFASSSPGPCQYDSILAASLRSSISLPTNRPHNLSSFIRYHSFSPTADGGEGRMGNGMRSWETGRFCGSKL